MIGMFSALTLCNGSQCGWLTSISDMYLRISGEYSRSSRLSNSRLPAAVDVEAWMLSRLGTFARRRLGPA